MHIVLVGLNHRSAPIELRERLAFGCHQLPQALSRLRSEVGLEEAAILSTCNRVEIYGRVAELPGAVDRLHRFLSDHAQIDPQGLAASLYSYTEPQSVAHLFAVASGLDSMVLGESEILLQVKRAYESARTHGAISKGFNGLFQRALNTAKTVRAQTAIGWGATSVGGVSVELAEKIFGRLSEAIVLLIGAGKIGELTLQRLTDRGVRDVRVINRSHERAVEVATRYGACSLPLEGLGEQLAAADIVITSTGASSWLVRQDAVAAAMRPRHQRPLCFIDLGVPRNIDPAIGKMENVYLYNVDDLQGLVAHAHRERQEALTASRAIIDRKVEGFLSWWQEEMAPCSPSCSVPAAAP